MPHQGGKWVLTEREYRNRMGRNERGGEMAEKELAMEMGTHEWGRMEWKESLGAGNIVME